MKELSPDYENIELEIFRVLVLQRRYDEVHRARAYETYRDFYLKTNGQVYWSDTHQLSYYTADFETVLQQASPGYPAGSLMITEVYVPRGELPAFMKETAQDFREYDVNLIYGTVRLIGRDNETFLAWARQDYA